MAGNLSSTKRNRAPNALLGLVNIVEKPIDTARDADNVADAGKDHFRRPIALTEARLASGTRLALLFRRLMLRLREMLAEKIHPECGNGLERACGGPAKLKGKLRSSRGKPLHVALTVRSAYRTRSVRLEMPGEVSDTRPCCSTPGL